jgi:hypothetical protein
MDKKFWLMLFDVTRKRNKSVVNGIILVVNLKWRIMGDKNINLRKRGQCGFNLRLLKQKIPARFVFPGTTKTAKTKSVKFKSLKVQINNRRGKDCAGVMVAFDSQNMFAFATRRCPADGLVGKITARNQKISLIFRQLAYDRVIVCND